MNQPLPHNPFASVADLGPSFASGRAAALAANGSFPTKTLQVTPANLTGPVSAAPIGVFAMVGKVTGRFMFGFELIFTDSAADTVTLAVLSLTGVTSVTGGTAVGNFTWESSAITITGGASLGAPASWSAALPAGGLTQTGLCTGVVVAPAPTTPVWINFEVLAATHNLSAMSLNAFCYEF